MRNRKLEKKFINSLKEKCHTGDPEFDHGEADGFLSIFLLELGYEDLVEEYNKVEKWYA